MTNQEIIEKDAISREDAILALDEIFDSVPMELTTEILKLRTALRKKLPSVQPKTGHWIPSHIPESILDECSECGFSCGAFTFNYCPNCGCRMVKPQESEETDATD